MPYLGPPEAPRAAGLVAAVRWACDGHAEADSPTTKRLLAELRQRLDPHCIAAFSDVELLAAWNDVPLRKRADVVQLLRGCRDSWLPTVSIAAPARATHAMLVD
ncbi:MAG: DUF6197 family protein [Streptomyces sp.]|uniref:DUF6197 family protein n=1 Tax=Streptomyces sp. TaxID=1931 RepID=UPI003D6B30B0